MKFIRIVLAIGILCAVAVPAMADTDVAIGATVTTSGSGFGLSPGWCCANYQPAWIVDGSPEADGTQWNVGSAFWSGAAPDATDVLTITLNGTYTIDAVVLQADDNDAYDVQYWNGTGWTDLNDFGAVGGYGLTTRPELYLSTPVATDAFEITNANGDGYYAVGQFEAFAPAVPEPSSSMLMLTGLGVLGALIARRRIA
jgi:hypothetical protein